jgi:hypothetical protein
MRFCKPFFPVEPSGFVVGGGLQPNSVERQIVSGPATEMFTRRISCFSHPLVEREIGFHYYLVILHACCYKHGKLPGAGSLVTSDAHAILGLRQYGYAHKTL